jgi:hypothetical protein
MDKNSPERLEEIENQVDLHAEGSITTREVVRRRVDQMNGADLQAHMCYHFGADSTEMLDGWDSIRSFVFSDMLDSAQSDKAYLKSIIQDYVNAMPEDEILHLTNDNAPKP